MKMFRKVIEVLGQVVVIFGGGLLIICLLLSDLVPIGNKCVFIGMVVIAWLYVGGLESTVETLKDRIKRLRRR